MLTTWDYSVRTEAERVIHCAHQIIIGFYKTNNFNVLPYGTITDGDNIVTFPSLPYNTIPRFWEQAKKVNVDSLPLDINPKFVDQVAQIVQIANINPPNFKDTQKLWEQAESEVVAEIYKLLPAKKDIINKIIIYPTSFGTGCSFNQIEDNGDVILYLREDRGISTITEAIITVLTRNDIFDKLKGLWSESEIITDFMVTKTSLSPVLQKYESVSAYTPTIKSVRGVEQVKLTQLSNDFYQKLGIPNFDKPFSHHESTPKLFDKPIENLTETEKKLALVLIKNENQITDFDTLGNAIFQSEDDFSLYAISKTVQRLRDKFEANGISGSYIQTLRGKGYVLKN